MDDATTTFNRLRPRLQGIAYRMLASSAEAEDVVQDVWLRWHDADKAALASAEAWLVTTTTRLSIDRLRAAKVRRDHYVGFWLPEPVLGDGPATPEQTKELADDVSVAFLVMLERLSPESRAAFLLREVFDADYDEVAAALGKSEAACRQIVHRAKAQLKEERPRKTVASEIQLDLMRRFSEALSHGDFAALNSMLDENAELIGDGGGKVPSFGKVMHGGKRIAQLFYATHRRLGDTQRIEIAVLNGQWALLRFFGDVLESAQTYETDGERIVRIHVQRNPDKLVRLAAAFGGC
jgi:RNA polymerase sigma-70 factor (ECF subfamily)